MTNQQGTEVPLANHGHMRLWSKILRYKIGYATDDWGMRSSSPSGIPDHAGAWVRYEDHIAALVEAQQPAPSAAVALSDDLRDRLVAISEAIADQDDRAAQAMLKEILAAPQPSPTPQADSQPAPVLGEPTWTVFNSGAQVAEVESLAEAMEYLTLERLSRQWCAVCVVDQSNMPKASAPADSVLEDAARWQALPAFFEEHQIDAMKLYRDIDAYLDAARKQGGA